MRGAVCQWHTSSADRAEGETLDRSEAERRAAWPSADQAESEGKGPSVLAALQRDNFISLRRWRGGKIDTNNA